MHNARPPWSPPVDTLISPSRLSLVRKSIEMQYNCLRSQRNRRAGLAVPAPFLSDSPVFACFLVTCWTSRSSVCLPRFVTAPQRSRRSLRIFASRIRSRRVSSPTPSLLALPHARCGLLRLPSAKTDLTSIVSTRSGSLDASLGPLTPRRTSSPNSPSPLIAREAKHGCRTCGASGTR
jgi:hypothetical protein